MAPASRLCLDEIPDLLLQALQPLVELDDRPGPVRDCLVAFQRGWLELVARSFRYGVEARQFRADADPEQFAQDLYGVMLSYHLHARLLADAQAERRARRAFRRLLEGAQW